MIVLKKMYCIKKNCIKKTWLYKKKFLVLYIFFAWKNVLLFQLTGLKRFGVVIRWGFLFTGVEADVTSNDKFGLFKNCDGLKGNCLMGEVPVFSGVNGLQSIDICALSNCKDKEIFTDIDII